MKTMILILLMLCLSAFSAKKNFDQFQDGEMITISGKVHKVDKDEFELKSNGKITNIEMDDYSDWMKDGLFLKNGDQVVVTGVVDKDFLEKDEIKASSIYVKHINTYYNSKNSLYTPTYSATYTTVKTLPDNSSAQITGKVIKVDGREFIVDTGKRVITIDTEDMSYNPLDDKGLMRINRGDYVQVSGIVEENFFKNKKLNANQIIKFSRLDLNERMSE